MSDCILLIMAPEIRFFGWKGKSKDAKKLVLLYLFQQLEQRFCIYRFFILLVGLGLIADRVIAWTCLSTLWNPDNKKLSWIDLAWLASKHPDNSIFLFLILIKELLICFFSQFFYSVASDCSSFSLYRCYLASSKAEGVNEKEKCTSENYSNSENFRI